MHHWTYYVYFYLDSLEISDLSLTAIKTEPIKLHINLAIPTIYHCCTEKLHHQHRLLHHPEWGY